MEILYEMGLLKKREFERRKSLYTGQSKLQTVALVQPLKEQQPNEEHKQVLVSTYEVATQVKQSNFKRPSRRDHGK